MSALKTDQPQVRPRILIVDDEHFNLNALHGLLRDEHQVMVATDGAKGLAAALQTPPDLILLDISMPGMDGFEVCQRLKADPVTASIPVLFITASGDVDHEARAFELGASDFIAKPFHSVVVHARVRAHVRLKLQADALARLAFVDGLTGVANRRSLDERLQSEWLRAVRAASPLSALLLDIDFFKLFNDRYGHAAGDGCLRQVASILSGHTRKAGDLLARYGGEEFAVLLPSTPHAGALALAEQLRRSVDEANMEHAASSLGHVTVSIGASTVIPSGAAAPTSLFEAADTMLYEVKAAGRNGVRGRDLGSIVS
jgi:diguanylate cyclase (GGDEF)-like protein